MVLYINGASVSTNSNTTNPAVHGTPNYDTIGMYGHRPLNNGYRAEFNGQIDQFRAFQSELTSSQVLMLYEEDTGATKFTEGSNTVLVFKSGSGTINLTDTSLPGPKVGDLRTNEDQTSAGSASAMEHYMSTGWRVFNNFTTLATCDYPTTATALYQFDDDVTDTCNNYNGTAYSLNPYVAGKFGKAASFNGTSSYISVGTLIGGNVYTYSFWAKPNSIASGVYGAMIGSASPDVTYYQDNSKLSIYNGSASSYLTASNIFLNTTDWVNIVAVATGSQILIYRNGILSTTFNHTPANSQSIIFGKHPRFSLDSIIMVL